MEAESVSSGGYRNRELFYLKYFATFLHIASLSPCSAIDHHRKHTAILNFPTLAEEKRQVQST